jgi:hypothetical protein
LITITIFLSGSKLALLLFLHYRIFVRLSKTLLRYKHTQGCLPNADLKGQ